jgi:hypothetical protein
MNKLIVGFVWVMSEVLVVSVSDEWIARGACLSDEWIARGVCLRDEWIARYACLNDEWIARGVWVMSEYLGVPFWIMSVCLSDEWIARGVCLSDEWIARGSCLSDEWIDGGVCLSDELIARGACLSDEWIARGVCLSNEWTARRVCLRDEWITCSQSENPNHEFLHDDLQFCWKNHVSVPEEDKEYWKEGPGEELGPEIRNQGHSQPYPGLGKFQKHVLCNRYILKYFDGLHLMIVLFVILLWRDFIYVKIPEWDANKSANRLHVYAPKVE